MHTDESLGSHHRLTGWMIGALSFALVIYPPLYVLLHLGGVEGGFSYVCGDAFHYLTIARRSHFGWFTYDGSTVTNGFHPLWQWLLTALFSGQSADLAGKQLAITIAVSTLFTALGVAFASVTTYRLTRSRLLALLTIPGLYYLLLGSILNSHPVWDDVGGMECSLSALIAGCLMLVASNAMLAGQARTLDDLIDERGLGSTFVRLSLLLPFLVLARLDDIFIIIALGLLPMLSARPLPQRIMASLRIVAPSVVVVLAYVIYNRISAGTFLPISGMTKSGFVLPKSLYIIAAGFFPLLIDIKNKLSSQQSDPVSLAANTFRGVQLLLPAVVAGLYLLFEHKRLRVSARVALLGAFSGGVVLKSFYNFADVHLWHQGTWYFAFNIMFVSVLGAVMLEPAYRAAVTTRRARIVCLAFLGTWIALSSARTAIMHTYDFDRHEVRYWLVRDKTVDALRHAEPDPRLLAFDDGLTAYTMPFDTIHGFAFAADITTFKALQAESLLAHAYQRGHRIITSANYMTMPTPITDSDGLREFLKKSFLEDKVKAELDKFDYKLLYIVPETGSPFIEFSPNGAALALAPLR